MVPVKQDIFFNDIKGRRGNCFQAAIASILELPLNHVPHFAELDDTWFDMACHFIKQYGFDIYDCYAEELPYIKGSYVLVIGKSERGCNHSVIYQNGKLVHDPHFSNAGVIDISWCAVIKKII